MPLVSIGSSTLKVTSQPRTAPFRRVGPAEIQLHVVASLDAIGSVTFAGAAGERALGWSVGFLQA